MDPVTAEVIKRSLLSIPSQLEAINESFETVKCQLDMDVEMIGSRIWKLRSIHIEIKEVKETIKMMIDQMMACDTFENIFKDTSNAAYAGAYKPINSLPDKIIEGCYLTSRKRLPGRISRKTDRFSSPFDEKDIFPEGQKDSYSLVESQLRDPSDESSIVESRKTENTESDTSDGKKSAADRNIYGLRRQVTERKKENSSDSDSKKNGEEENKVTLKDSNNFTLEKKEKPEVKISKDTIFGEHSVTRPKIRKYSQTPKISSPIKAYRGMMGLNNSLAKPSQRKPLFKSLPSRFIDDPIVDDPYDEILRWYEEKSSHDGRPRKWRRRRRNRDQFR